MTTTSSCVPSHVVDASRAAFIFVGGAPRSGTTLVQNILDSHPDVAGGPEFDPMPSIMRLRRALRSGIQGGRIDSFLSEEEADAAIVGFISSLLTPFAARRGARFLSEKTPWNILDAEDLLELFPDAKMIVCLRDPRAVVSSMLAVGKRARAAGTDPAPFTRNAHGAIKLLRKCHEAGFRARERFPERVHCVVYEDLVNDPAASSRALAAFLHVQWDDAMTRPGSQSHAGERAAADGIWYTRERYRSDPIVARRDAWRDELSPDDQALVTEAFANDARLREFGYRLDPSEFPVSTRLVARVRRNGRDGVDLLALKVRSIAAQAVRGMRKRGASSSQ